MSVALVSMALGAAKPLATVAKYDGKFQWIKLATLPADAVKSLASAKSVTITVTFKREVKLKKDPGGNTWFTFILADQGSDWKWNQSTGGGGVPVKGNSIKAGTYKVMMPLTGIPKKVLGDKMQVISVGPNTSGLSAPAAFTIDQVKGQ